MIFFKINEYITLRLEEGKTVIYVKDKKFISCKSLLLNLSGEVKDYNVESLSIDELIDNYSSSFDTKIPIEIINLGKLKTLVVYIHDMDTIKPDFGVILESLNNLTIVTDIPLEQIDIPLENFPRLKFNIVKRKIVLFDR